MRDSFVEITLRSGEHICLVQFLSTLPYTGLLEGRVVPEVNKMILESHAYYVKRLWPDLPSMILKEIELKKKAADILPETRFIGEFRISGLDPDSPKSGFVAIWFQDEVQPIISPENLEYLTQLTLSDIRKR